MSGDFGKLESNRQTLTFQTKAIKQNKHTYKAKISTFTSILLKFIKFFESGFAKQHQSFWF